MKEYYSNFAEFVNAERYGLKIRNVEQESNLLCKLNFFNQIF